MLRARAAVLSCRSPPWGRGRKADVSDPTSAILERVKALRDELLSQGQAVGSMLERAVEAVFERDESLAQKVIADDEAIDRVDIEIERRAVELLSDAMAQGARLGPGDVRMLLTIVKVNNELERIADCAVNIAERIRAFQDLQAQLPPKFRVMANSVVGIMESANLAMAHMDSDTAQLVLESDDATEAFKDAILRDVEQQLVAGQHSVDFAFALRTVAVNLGRMSDHCTNIAEQVIYVTTGKIVRHEGEKWSAPEAPEGPRGA